MADVLFLPFIGNVGIQLNNHVNGQDIGNQLPPPPPGFVQPQHMNSFGEDDFAIFLFIYVIFFFRR